MNLLKIDHVHIYVHDLKKAEHWYKRVLGFSRDESLLFWFTQGGPLVLKNKAAVISLFLRTHQPPGNTVAFSWMPRVSVSYYASWSRNPYLIQSAIIRCRCPFIFAILTEIRLN
ncbi:VOC family protein [Pantoea stewartii]|uniref:VOC family protein n=1 Tax=Pantoea stewartii TaxID=66269 RepID=UPI000ABE5EE6